MRTMMISNEQNKNRNIIGRIVALTTVIVGLASAQTQANQAYNRANSNTVSPNGGFLAGWVDALAMPLLRHMVAAVQT
jgi:hypothetical protein